MRQKGYYWVLKYDEWTIAEWVGDRWFLIGNECEDYDNDLQEIGERVERIKLETETNNN